MIWLMHGKIIWNTPRITRPDLYGREVIKNAFVLFLSHIFHSGPGDFLPLFTQFLIDFSQRISRALPLDELKKDLTLLGYSDISIDSEFSILKENAQDYQNLRTDECRTGEF